MCPALACSPATQLNSFDAESTGTRTELNSTATRRLPLAPGTRGLESMLLTFPGFAANANGAIHPRGAHNQMTYVIDGMPVSDQLTGAFANAVDPSIVQTLELFTGNVRGGTPLLFSDRQAGRLCWICAGHDPPRKMDTQPGRTT